MSSDERTYYVVTTGSPFALSSGTSETTLLTITPSQNTGFKGLWLDLSNIVYPITIRSKYDINNNSTYITFETKVYVPGALNDCVLVGTKCPIGYKIRFTLQSSIAEGSSKNIPYEYHRLDLSNVDA